MTEKNLIVKSPNIIILPKDSSSINNNKISYKNNTNVLDIKDPPDGGARAWCVMIAAFICNGILFGVINTYGVVYKKLQTQLIENSDTEASSKAALLGSLTIGITFLFSPLSGILTDKIGLRWTTLLGGIFASGGMLLSSFCTDNIELLYITYGVMFGLGAALAYTPSLAILGHYFKKNLGMVNGFVTSGASIFTAIMPKMIHSLLQSHGLVVVLRVISLMSSFIILCALIYKPLQEPPPPTKVKPGRSSMNRMLRSVINVDNWKKKKYVIWVLSIPVALFGYFVPYVHIGKYVEINFSGAEVNLPVMCIGISSGIGRILFGYIADCPRVNRILLQQLSLFVIGVMTMMIITTRIYPILLCFILVLGLFDGCFISLLGPIAFDICGPHGATQAISFLLGLSSIPLTVGPPVAGMLFDHTGSYDLAFILAGIPLIIGSSALFLTRCVKNDRKSTDPNPILEPLAKTAWDCENQITNPKLKHSNELLNIKYKPENPEMKNTDDQMIGNKKILLASTESLNDVN